MKNGLLYKVLIVFIILISVTGCSVESTKTNINTSIENAKKEITNQIEESVQNSINNQVDNITTSIESKLDPELGKIRSDMANLKDMVLIYYNINTSFPDIKTIETFFNDKLSNRKIEYIINNEATTATIRYIGDKYTTEKIPNIIINKSIIK